MEEEKEEKIRELDKLQGEIKEEIVKDEKLTEAEHIARIYVDCGGSEKISLRAFTKKLNEVHKIKCSYIKVRNILINQGVYKKRIDEIKKEEEVYPGFEGGTKVLYDFFFNVVLAGSEVTEPPEELLKNPRLIWKMGEEELEKNGKITDRILEKYTPFYEKHRLEFNFITIFLTSFLSRMITFKNVMRWKERKSSQSSEKQEPEKPIK